MIDQRRSVSSGVLSQRERGSTHRRRREIGNIRYGVVCLFDFHYGCGFNGYDRTAHHDRDASQDYLGDVPAVADDGGLATNLRVRAGPIHPCYQMVSA